jgi:dihydrodipicolinate synthase/N-acetylneuraminate lyase
MFPDELKARLRNVHTYAATPFRPDNLLEVDRDALARNLEFLINRGVQVISVGGGTGEIEALSTSELEALAGTALEVASDRALIITCVPGNLKAALDLAPRYEALGARILLGMPPLIRGQVPGDLEGVLEYYRLLARASGLPLMPYNTQGWPPEFFVRLAEIDRIIGIKDPCLHPHNFFKAIKRVGDRFVWIGNKRHDAGVLQFRYQAGMEGFTSGISNFVPEYELRMHEASRVGDWARIVALQEVVAPLEGLRLAHDDAAMVKAGMDLVGLCGGRVRPPRRDASPEARAALRATLEGLGLNLPVLTAQHGVEAATFPEPPGG